MSKSPRSQTFRDTHTKGRPDDAAAADLGSIDLKLLGVFEAVLTESSFSRAARRLGTTQSAVSQAVARLRRIFEDELFERTGRGVRATPRATELEGPIRQALALLRSSLNPIATFDPDSSARVFFVAMQSYVAEAMSLELSEALPGASKMQLYIVASESRNLESGLRYGEPEIAITREAMTDPGVNSELLYNETLVLLARRDHPVVSADLDWDGYARLRHVALSQGGPSDTSPIDYEFKRRGLERTAPIAMPTAASALRVVEQSDFVCVLGRRLAQRFANWHKLGVHEVPLEGLMLPMFMVWHERFNNDRGHLWLRQRLRSIMTGVDQRKA